MAKVKNPSPPENSPLKYVKRKGLKNGMTHVVQLPQLKKRNKKEKRKPQK